MVSKDLEYGIVSQARALEQQFITTAHTAVEFVVDVRESLDAIKDNTKKLFFWTSTIVLIFLGLFILDQLVKLRHQLTKLNEYQSVFRGMWLDDREEERRAKIPEARERLLKRLYEIQITRDIDFTLEDINPELETAPSLGSEDWDMFVNSVARRIARKYTLSSE